jgi:hypothetical protein
MNLGRPKDVVMPADIRAQLERAQPLRAVDDFEVFARRLRELEPPPEAGPSRAHLDDIPKSRVRIQVAIVAILFALNYLAIIRAVR